MEGLKEVKGECEDADLELKRSILMEKLGQYVINNEKLSQFKNKLHV